MQIRLTKLTLYFIYQNRILLYTILFVYIRWFKHIICFYFWPKRIQKICSSELAIIKFKKVDKRVLSGAPHTFVIL